MTVTRASRTGKDFRIVDALNAEWDELTRENQPTVRLWAAKHQAVANCSDLADVLATVPGDPDGVLRALLIENAEGDQLAGRVVLQAMVAKIVRMALRDCRAGVDEYVAAMWCRICTYPMGERPKKIAANLALDALKAVNRETFWTRSGVEVAAFPSDAVMDYLHTQAMARARLDHNAGIEELSAQGVIATADRLGLINAQTRDVLLTVYADGLSGRAAADRHQTTPEMIRFRCSKAVRRLAQHSASLAEAA